MVAGGTRISAPEVRPRDGGFTLVELLVTIAILVVVITIGVPAFGGFIRDQRLTGTANDLVVALARARSAAITASAPARICPSSNPSSNNPCAGTTDYSDGWVLVVDGDSNGAIDTSGADRLVRVWQGPGLGIASFQGPTNLTYGPRGLKEGTAVDQFDLQGSGCGPAWQRRVAVNAIGSVRTQSQSC